jgi:DNA-binding HxlR family transcriptional regulator
MKSTPESKKTPATETSGDTPEHDAAGLRPVERALDLLGARWTLILIRHLLAGPHGFQELRERTGITPRLLSVRLSEMIAQGFVEKVPFGNRARYTLTDFGKSVEPVVREIALWWLQHAMPRSGSHQGATPAAVFEAISYLIQRDRTTDADTRYDLRLTVREDGGWAVEFTDASNHENSARQAAQDTVAESIPKALENKGGEEAERLTETRPDVRPAATDAAARGSIVWHPKPYRPDSR